MFPSVLFMLVALATLCCDAVVKDAIEERPGFLERHERSSNQTKSAGVSSDTILQNINASMFEYFYVSDYFNDRRYWLTKEAPFFSAAFAQTVCVFFGGFLAEIDTLEEYYFAKRFIIDRGQHYTSVATGGTDERQEGVWVNRHSGTLVASLWASGQPDDYTGNQNCQFFSKPKDWLMEDNPCVFTGRTDIGFLCEIPE